MSIWEAPQFPIEDGLGWGTPYLFVCFNNKCPLYEQGWNHIKENYGRHASYRCIRFPDENNYGCMAVFSQDGATEQILNDEIAAARLQALKARIEKKHSILEDCIASKDWKKVLKILFDPTEQDVIKLKAAEIIGEIGNPKAIAPIRNKQFGNGYLSKVIEKSLYKIHERYSTRECPFCAEITSKYAVICEHCGIVTLFPGKLKSTRALNNPLN